ncbi:MAG TPA: GH3 auxin-responsive promoter family protein, partial [Bacteroidia bacterium]|nr:GH3 auxin-responsive promoter family protein [Bacteroidia bacterium]
ESIKPFIDRIRKGEQNILWHSEIKWFAKSSGTTNDKSKFIPVSEESLDDCHYKGGKDMVSIHCKNYPDTKIFKGKSLALGGSHETDSLSSLDARHGDLSAIIIENLPKWAEYLRAPDISIALMNEWEEKLEKMAHATMEENVTSIAGVPSWMLILLKHILALSGKKSIIEVWPNLEVFFHGGVNFNPYKEQFKNIFNSSEVSYTETYTASEGFFGLQDQEGMDGEMLLMLDYGIFYEFLPMQNYGKENPKTLYLEEVDTETHYALIISTSAGLWRYMLGDTIMFTSLHPFRFRITGRTKHFINAFGEEVIVDNAENALKVACEKTGAIIKEYTAAPVYINNDNSGAHEWLIEFEKKPESLEYFTEMLDNALKSINSDYEAKRYHNMVLKEPIVHAAEQGTFYKWLKQKNKLGGQYKVPRLSNDRKYLDEILAGMKS